MTQKVTFNLMAYVFTGVQCSDWEKGGWTCVHSCVHSPKYNPPSAVAPKARTAARLAAPPASSRPHLTVPSLIPLQLEGVRPEAACHKQSGYEQDAPLATLQRAHGGTGDAGGRDRVGHWPPSRRIELMWLNRGKFANF